MKIFKNRNFMILWSGQSISKMGTILYDLAQMWYIYIKTGSSLALGLSVLCFTVPSVLVAPLAGVFADRLDKKKLIIYTDILNGVLMLLLSFFIFMDRYPLYILYIFMILSTMVTAVFNPAMSSAVPVIVETEDLKEANTLNQVTSQILNILGPALAGVLIAFVSMWLLFFLNGLSFLICALIEVFMTIPRTLKENTGQGIKEQFIEGLKYILSDKALFYLVIAGGVIINFFLAPLSIYATILANDVLKVGSAGFGMVNSAISAGALMGALLIMINVFKDKYKMAVIGLSLEGLPLLIFGVIPNYYAVLFAAAVLGLGISLASVGISTLYQTMIPKDKMGRTMALTSALCNISIPLGTLLGSAIIIYVSISIVLAVSGILVFITGISLIPLLGVNSKTSNPDPASVHPSVSS